MKVGDILLESIVHDPLRVFERFLGEFSEFEASGGLGVEGEEGGIEVFDELVKGFLGGSNSSVSHFVIPHFRKGDSSFFAHSIEHSCDLSFISVIERYMRKYD